MAFKTAAQLFGDGAGNGAAVPRSVTNPPGTAAANRGIQFGESLTAAITNRPSYALALNDEDLNSRIVAFETTGLDAAYRLGNIATAGGGRSITLDGGPVELVPALAASLEDDGLNACLRLDMTGNAVAGGTGLDVVSRRQARPFAHFFARSTQDLTAIGVADPDTAVLNPAGADIAMLDLDTGISAENTLIAGADFVEITAGPYAGFYGIHSCNVDQLLLRNIDGAAASFVADTAVTYRIWRSSFRVSHSANATGNAIPGGIVVAGGLQYNDTPVITLIPGALTPLETAGIGSRYALQVSQVLNAGDSIPVACFRIDATGICRGGVQASPNVDFQFRPAFYHRAGTAAIKNCGFVSLNVGTSQTHGLVVVERRSTATSFTGVANGSALTGVSALFAVCPGQLLEIIAPSTHVGVYVVKDCSTPTSWVIDTLDGVAASFSSDTVTAYLLEGMYSGRVSTFTSLPAQTVSAGGAVTTAEDDTISQVRITTPISGNSSIAATALLLGMAQTTNPAEAMYLRCVGAKADGEDFALAKDGIAWAKDSWQAPRLVGASFQWSTLRTVVKTQNTLLAVANTAGQWSTGAVPAALADAATLRYPLVDLIDGSTMTTVSVPHNTNTSRAGASRGSAQVFKLAYNSTSASAIGSQTFDDGTGGGGTPIVISGLTEVIDLSTNQYYLSIISGTAFDDQIRGPVKVTMTTRTLQP